MPHSTPLISMIVAGLVLAFILGALASRLKLPPLVGYLIAGIIVGPHTPGLVGDIDLATQLSEIGVVLLMFGVGLRFSLRDLLSVRALALPGAAVQFGGATLLGLGLALLMGWGLGAGLIFGLALSVASTVVLLEALEGRRMIDSDTGRIAVGWLIVSNLAVVLALILIPSIASLSGVEGVAVRDPFVGVFERLLGIEVGLVGIFAITIVKLAAFAGFMVIVGRRLIPMVLRYTARSGSRQLSRLAVFAIALGVAAGAAYLLGVSLAIGAFLAGMILSESELSHRTANESLPLRDAFSVLFFVAVGMLFDPAIFVSHPLPLLTTVFIIVIGKSVLAYMILRAFKRPVGTALVVSSSLAQIGEFSFILAALGVGLGLRPEAGRDLILAGALISIVLNPLIFLAIDSLRPWIEARSARPVKAVAGGAPFPTERTEPDLTMSSERHAERHPDEVIADDQRASVPTTRSGHVVLVGFGRVGRVVGEALLESRTPFVVVEEAEDRGTAARARDIEVVPGNAAAPGILELANVAGAATVVVAIPDAFEAGEATRQARKLNPSALIIARARSDEEETHLKSRGANVVILGEREIGLGMVDLIQRDSKAVAELAASDAVESALAPLAAAATSARLQRNPNILAEAIETAQAEIQHPDAGPAEPPAMVSAYGEEPAPSAADTAPEAIELSEDESVPVETLAALDGASLDDVAAAAVEAAPPTIDAPAAPAVPEVLPEPPVVRPLKPASTPGSPFAAAAEPARPFNPEVPPSAEEEEKA